MGPGRRPAANFFYYYSDFFYLCHQPSLMLGFSAELQFALATPIRESREPASVATEVGTAKNQ
jgi:hypothetical protein